MRIIRKASDAKEASHLYIPVDSKVKELPKALWDRHNHYYEVSKPEFGPG